MIYSQLLGFGLDMYRGDGNNTYNVRHAIKH